MTVYVSDQGLATRFGVSRQTIWRWMKADIAFPRPISLSPRCTRWKITEVEDWEQHCRDAA